ncbi:MAG: PP2C family protein-serine/threonine phosphatase, partial [Planctomycetota bacterium]
DATKPVRFFGRTDPGRRRKINEDAFIMEDEYGFGIVCDGMGGHAAGEVASTMAVELVTERLREALPPWSARQSDSADLLKSLPRTLLETVETTNAAIYARGTDDPRIEEGRHMGTTLLVLCFVGRHAILAHIGDSRIYRVRDGVIEALTEDHSVLTAAPTKGGGKSRKRKYVTRALGTRPRVLPELKTTDALPGDFFILCSDGLTDYLDDDELARFLTCVDDDELPMIPRQLVALANQRGGRDNITIVLAAVPPGETGRGGLFDTGTQPELELSDTARHGVETQAAQRPTISVPNAPPAFEPPPAGEAEHTELGAVDDSDAGVPPPPLEPPPG